MHVRNEIVNSPLSRAHLKRIWALPVLLSIMLGCNADRIARLEKQNSELEAKLDSLSKAASLDVQAKCAQQARVVFSESGLSPKKDALAGYTDHYNQGLNRCFVRLNSIEVKGKAATTYILVQDAFEGKLYAEYYGSNTPGIPADAVTPNVCTITQQGGEEKECHSNKEFEESIRVYMEQ